MGEFAVTPNSDWEISFNALESANAIRRAFPRPPTLDELMYSPAIAQRFAAR